jgi:hypothetical protein
MLLFAPPVNAGLLDKGFASALVIHGRRIDILHGINGIEKLSAV